MIDEVFDDEDVEHSEEEPGVGTRSDGEVLVALRGLGSARVDDDHSTAASDDAVEGILEPRFAHERPTRDERVRTDDEGEVGSPEVRQVLDQGRSVQQVVGDDPRGSVFGVDAVPPFHPEGLLQPGQHEHGGVPEGRRVAVEGRKGFAAVGVADLLEARGDLVECIVPADLGELARAANALERAEDPVVVVGHLDHGGRLRAEEPLGVHVSGVWPDAHQDAVVHRRDQPAHRFADATERVLLTLCGRLVRPWFSV